MQLRFIENKEKGRFLNRYDLHYSCDNGEELIYEIVSRNKELSTFEDLSETNPDAVLVIATNRDGQKMLVNREFRPETGHVVYGLPGGLIEKGESIEQCANRELFEETGLHITRIKAVLPAAYCTVGIGNEMTVCVFAEADGELMAPTIGKEEISPLWLTKNEMQKCIKEKKFGSWCLAFAWIWANSGLPE